MISNFQNQSKDNTKSINSNNPRYLPIKHQVYKGMNTTNKSVMRLGIIHLVRDKTF